jgi:hypothetical protein
MLSAMDGKEATVHIDKTFIPIALLEPGDVALSRVHNVGSRIIGLILPYTLAG